MSKRLFDRLIRRHCFQSRHRRTIKIKRYEYAGCCDSNHRQVTMNQRTHGDANNQGYATPPEDCGLQLRDVDLRSGFFCVFAIGMESVFGTRHLLQKWFVVHDDLVAKDPMLQLQNKRTVNNCDNDVESRQHNPMLDGN